MNRFAKVSGWKAPLGYRALLPLRFALLRLLLVISALWMSEGGLSMIAAPDETPSKEQQLKAAFLFNFTKFVEWPTNRFESDTDPIIIGILGANGVEEELVKLVRGRKVNGREVIVRLMSSYEEKEVLHIVFVGAGEDHRLPDAWKKEQPRGILTVGESDRFEAAGGMIVFSKEADKIRFKINMSSVDLAGLKVSAQLQKLAKSIRK